MTTITLSPISRLSDSTKDKIVNGIRYICLFLFAYTAYAKIIDHDRFLHGLTRVHLISGFAVLISFLVPVVEVLVVILLIIPRTLKIGLSLFTLIMSAFTIYIISAMIWEPKLPCHCGGAIEKLSWGQHIWFNIAFIFLASMGLWLIKSSKTFKN